MDFKKTLKRTLPLAIGAGLLFYFLSLWHSKSINSHDDVTSAEPVHSESSLQQPTFSEQQEKLTKVASAAESKFQQYQNTLQFKEEIKAFAAAIETRSMTENIALYQQLLPEILNFESQQYISRGESYYLQASLLSKIYLGDLYLEEQLAELARQYPQEPASNDHLDDKFYLYKKQEAHILKEVMAMDSYPDGLTREQYLRKRLLEARNRIYQ